MSQSSDLRGDRESWDGRSYYGRRQLKPAPFNERWSAATCSSQGCPAAAQLLATALDLARGREARAPTVRRGRYLSLLAPVLGSAVPDPRPAHAAALLQHAAGVQADFADVARLVDPGDVRRPQRSHAPARNS